MPLVAARGARWGTSWLCHVPAVRQNGRRPDRDHDIDDLTVLAELPQAPTQCSRDNLCDHPKHPAVCDRSKTPEHGRSQAMTKLREVPAASPS